MIALNGCNEISSGDKRRKFEFLYSMSNSVTMFSEYSGSLTYYKDLSFYEERIKLIREDIKNIKRLNNWDTSQNLKLAFVKVIDENLESVLILKNQNLSPEENIKKQYEAILIRERVADLKNSIEAEIVKVGKE